MFSSAAEARMAKESDWVALTAYESISPAWPPDEVV
jgi:hypothetical protein